MYISRKEIIYEFNILRN